MKKRKDVATKKPDTFEEFMQKVSESRDDRCISSYLDDNNITFGEEIFRYAEIDNEFASYTEKTWAAHVSFTKSKNLAMSSPLLSDFDSLVNHYNHEDKEHENSEFTIERTSARKVIGFIQRMLIDLIASYDMDDEEFLKDLKAAFLFISKKNSVFDIRLEGYADPKMQLLINVRLHHSDHNSKGQITDTQFIAKKFFCNEPYLLHMARNMMEEKDVSPVTKKDEGDRN